MGFITVKENLIESLENEFAETSQKSTMPVSTKVKKVRANELYDPSNEILKVLFEEEQELFPSGIFSENPWVRILNVVGLKQELDLSDLIKIGEKIAFESKRKTIESFVAPRLVRRASKL